MAWVFRWTFLPTPPPRGAWVFRWTFSSLPPLLPPLPHLQIFVSLRYRTFLLGTENAVGGAWVFVSVCHLVLLLLLHLLLLHTSYISGNSRQSSFCPENCPLLSGELSTDSRQSSDSYFSSVKSRPELDIKLAQIWLTNKSQSNTPSQKQL